MAGPLFCTISSRYSFRTDSRSVAVSSAVRTDWDAVRTALAVRLKHFLDVRTALAVSSEKINIIAVRTAPAVRSKRIVVLLILTELDASRVFVESPFLRLIEPEI